MAVYRKAYVDRRGRRIVAGSVVATTDHPAASANGPAVHQRFDLDNGVLVLRLPPNTYLLHAQLRGPDGEEWAESEYITLEDA